jgi:hypothetical protein
MQSGWYMRGIVAACATAGAARFGRARLLLRGGHMLTGTFLPPGPDAIGRRGPISWGGSAQGVRYVLAHARTSGEHSMRRC